MTSANAELVQQVKASLPKLAITTKDLETPTKKFVCDFYYLFLEKYCEYMNFLAKRDFPLLSNGHLNYLKMNHPLEAITFHGMKKFFKSVEMRFFIEDIYSPSKERTKRYIQLCIHFIGFLSDVILEKGNFDETFDMLESVKLLQDQKDEIKQKYTEIAEEVGKRMEILNIVTQHHQNKLEELKNVQMDYEEKNNKLKAEKTKINTLNVMVQCDTLKLETIKEEIKKLEARIVDENEITSLINLLDIHKEKNENFMKEYKLKNEQLHKNNMEINHLESCLAELDRLSVHKPTNSEDFKKNAKLLASLKVELEKEEQINVNFKQNIKNTKTKNNLMIKQKDLNKEMLKEKDAILKKLDILELKQKQYMEKCKMIIGKFNKTTERISNGLMKINLEEQNIREAFNNSCIEILEKENAEITNFTNKC